MNPAWLRHAAFALALLVVAGLGLGALRTAAELGRLSEEIERRHAVLASARAVVAAVRELQRVARGEVIGSGGRPADRIAAARGEGAAALAELERLSVDHPPQRARARDLRARVGSFEIAVPTSLPERVERIRSGIGDRVLADLERVVGVIEADVRDGLAGLDAEEHAIRQVLRWQMGGGSLFALLLLAASWWSVHRHLKHQQRAEQEQARLIGELQQALAEVRTLSGLLPICAWCKKIRDDAGYWRQIEGYLSAHTDATFSHGICPDCKQKLEDAG